MLPRVTGGRFNTGEQGSRRMAMAGDGYDMCTEPPETEADVFHYLRERELCQTTYT